MMRILHTMLRVGNLERSIKFYTEVLGMKLLRTSENTEYKYSLAFLGYADESESAVIELTYNWGVESYDLGTAYGHIALGVDNIYETIEAIRAAGGKTVIAFAEDPDGYKIEFIENKQAQDALGN